MKRLILLPLLFLVSFAITSTILFEISLKYIDIENLYNAVDFIKPFKSISSFDFFVIAIFFISIVVALIITMISNGEFK